MKKLTLFLATCLAGCIGYAQTLTNNTGIPGGTRLIGGTNASDNLTLESNSSATKGLVCVGSNTFAVFDETTESFGVGRIPLNLYYTGDFYNNDNDTRALVMTNDYNGSDASAQIAAVSGSNNIALQAFSSGYNAYGLTDLNNANCSMLASNSSSHTAIINMNPVPLIFAIGGHTQADEKMRIDAHGNVGINQTAPGYPLEVAASGTAVTAIYATGLIRSNGVVLTSDKRFKKDITKLENANEKISKLNGYTYYMKTEDFKDWNFSKDQQIGFIAQEIKEVFPQLITEDKKGYLGVNYQGMIPVLLEAIKEQQTQITKQQNQITEQQKQFDDQQKQINELKQLVLANSNAGSQAPTGLAINLSDADVVVLNQNQPNPFAEQTLITYNIPQNTKTAQLLFYDASGKQIKSVDVSGKGQGQLNVYASDLSNGTYSYTLVIDGKIVSTRKMIKQQ